MPSPGDIAAPVAWEAPPPEDPAGEKRSAEIDLWLKETRAKEIMKNSRTMVLSPDGESFDAFRTRIVLHLGNELELSDGFKTAILTDSFTMSDRKRMAGLEPTVMLFVADAGADIEGNDAQAIMRMTRALKHFLFLSRGFGLSERCTVVIMIARMAAISASVTGGSRASWESLFPNLKIGDTVQGAIEAEFEAAATSQANPLQVTVVFDDGGFDDLSFMRGLIQESVDAVLRNFNDTIGQNGSDEKYHDATEATDFKKGRDQIRKAQEEDEAPRNAREKANLWMSRIIFFIQACLLVYGLSNVIPWEEAAKFFYLLLDMLGVPQMF